MNPQSHSWTLFAIGIGSVALAACNAPETIRSAGFTLRDSAGVQIAESSAPEWKLGEGWRADSTPIFSVGAAEGRPEQLFTDIRGVVGSSGGGVVVADGRSLELRAFDSRGAHRWTAGGRGQGPGEFSFIWTLLRLPGDSVLVHDRPARRVSVFAPSGKFARAIHLAVADDSTFAGSLTVTGAWSDGSLMALDFAVRNGMQPPEVTRRRTRVFRYDGEGFAKGLIATLPGEEFFEGDAAAHMLRRLPFGRNSYFATNGLRTIAGNSEGFELREYDEMGALRRVIRRAFTPRPVLPAEGEAERARTLAARRTERLTFFRGMPAPMLARISEAEDRATAAVPFPPTYPAWSAIMASDDGTIWVQEYESPAVKNSTERWTVFDAEGRWLGEVAMPAGFALREVRGDRLIGIAKDEADVESVRVYVLRKDG